MFHVLRLESVVVWSCPVFSRGGVGSGAWNRAVAGSGAGSAFNRMTVEEETKVNEHDYETVEELHTAIDADSDYLRERVTSLLKDWLNKKLSGLDELTSLEKWKEDWTTAPEKTKIVAAITNFVSDMERDTGSKKKEILSEIETFKNKALKEIQNPQPITT